MNSPLTRRSRRAALILPLLAAWSIASSYGDAGWTIAPTSREQARVFYNTVYQASEGVPSGWTGNVSKGNAGTTSAAFKDAILLRINYFRAMAGVPSTITFSDALSAEDQLAALMMSANSTLSHAPLTNWIDYTTAGADAAGKSNLALGTSDNGPTAVTGYIADNGSNNAATGHRRWVLYPPETTMGTGDVDASSDGSFYAANALFTLDMASFASPAPTPRDTFVAWPPKGYVPYTLVFPRWSFAYAGADFSAATVSMTRQGQAVPVRLETPSTGTADNALVWVPDGQDPANPPAPTAPAGDVTTTVTVGNVLIGGAAQSFTYTVTPFDPGVTGGDTVLPVLSGAANPAAGAANTYTFNAVPYATGYRWSASAILPLTLDLDAENGPGDVTISPAGTTVVSTANPANGSASYLFNSNPAETLTLSATFMPQAGATLSFHSQLGYATGNETARVQISTDGGGTWTDLYSLSGIGVTGQTETAYGAHSIDLGAYAGKSCTLRFGYVYSGSGEYFPANPGVGWFVDDISVTGALAVSAPTTADVPAGQTQFDFTPAAVGTYGLQVAPVFFGGYTADAGPMLTVAAGGTGPAVTVSATTPQAHAGDGTAGVFTLTRAGSDLSAKIVVHYKVKGSAKGGADYVKLSGKAKIKANHQSVTISVVPEGASATGKVTLVVQPGVGYSIGDPAAAKVKIVP